MKIDLISFLCGVILTVAVLIVVERFFGAFWGNRKLRKLQKEVYRLQSLLRKKDDLIKKSLKELQKSETKNEG